MQEERSLPVIYKNWRGETAKRTIIPRSSKEPILRWGSTKWHPEKGWLLSAMDPEKSEMREFALADCNFKGAQWKWATPKQIGVVEPEEDELLFQYWEEGDEENEFQMEIEADLVALLSQKPDGELSILETYFSVAKKNAKKNRGWVSPRNSKRKNPKSSGENR